MAFGTLSVLDTLRASRQSVAEYGEDQAFESIQLALDAHNVQFNTMLGDFIERTTDRQRAYGTTDVMKMEELDEFGRPDAQKVMAGQTVGFPLRVFGVAIQWTRKYMQTATVAELAAQVAAAQDGHVLRLQREIKRAIFTPTNSTFKDVLVDHVDLQVKAFLNADGAGVPAGPNGETFNGATHTHYMGRAGASLAESDVVAAIETVVEHHAAGQVVVNINRAQETAVRLFPNFVPYVDARIVPGANMTVANGQLNPTNIYNRPIGILNGAEVWVKPWMPVNYFFVHVKGVALPLVLRERIAGSANLQLVADEGVHPLHARLFEAEFGVGVYNRTNGSVLYTAGTTYTAPSL